MQATTVLFENMDWTVTADGIEHRGTGYRIERDALGRKRSDGLWAWPLHVLEKSWAEPDAFADAFVAAVRVFGLRPDAALGLAFAEAGLAEFEAGWRLRTAEIVPHPALTMPEGDRTRLRRAAGPERQRRHG